MTVDGWRTGRIRAAGGLLALLWMVSSPAAADCLTDSKGEVYCGGGRCLSDPSGTILCSRHYEGDAVSTREGRVLCGVGRCEKDSAGRVFCSSERGGAVLKDSRGNVRCYGRCEPATAENCESTKADSSG